MRSCSFKLYLFPMYMLTSKHIFLYIFSECQNNFNFITSLYHLFIPLILSSFSTVFSTETYNSIMCDAICAQSIDLTFPNNHIYNHSFSNIWVHIIQYQLMLKPMQLPRRCFLHICIWIYRDVELQDIYDWPDLNGIKPITALWLLVLVNFAWCHSSCFV